LLPEARSGRSLYFSLIALIGEENGKTNRKTYWKTKEIYGHGEVVS
jgi:hypothetical protein